MPERHSTRNGRRRCLDRQSREQRPCKLPSVELFELAAGLLPPAQQRVLSRAIKHAEYAEVKGGGHDLPLEKPGQPVGHVGPKTVRRERDAR